MDKIDRKILSLLQENARYPLKYLAQKVIFSCRFYENRTYGKSRHYHRLSRNN